MAQFDLASAPAAAGAAPLGRVRFEWSGGGAEAVAVAALFPEIAVTRRRLGSGSPMVLAAWIGSKEAEPALARANARGLPFVLFGDGLLRAPPRRGRATPRLSVAALGAAGAPAPAGLRDRDGLLARRGWERPELLERAGRARRDLATAQIGGAWWEGGALPRGERPALVILAETDTPRSEVPPALARAMLTAALAENAARDILLLAPRVGRLRSLLDESAARGCAVATAPIDPWAAIEPARTLYAAGGETGFLGLLAGRRVRCFAPSFYAGWGVTEDEPAVPQRPFRRSLDEIFAGACLLPSRHRDPYRGAPASFENTLALLADWRRIERANRDIAVCVGMSFWKRRRVADFLNSAASAPAFRRTAGGALATARRRQGAIAAWASRIPAGLAEAAARERIPLIRVEDGFIRSVGLGSDFLPAASLVLDRRGMYFDPGARSGLEILLCESEFDAQLIERARRLIGLVVARGITKYNLASGPRSQSLPAAAPGKRCILVPGQVEDDLSVRLGGGGIRGNLELLHRVRADNPDAFILYKPHPDVDAGHRIGAVPDRLAGNFADAVIRDISTAVLLDRIDALHTLTSLAGFEALLRRREVVVYGRPFYAGWGLTRDVAAIDRGRRLSLEELVAGVLILYPRYLDPLTRLPCAPEVLFERLDDAALWRPGPLVAARRLQGTLMRAWRRRAGRRQIG